MVESAFVRAGGHRRKGGAVRMKTIHSRAYAQRLILFKNLGWYFSDMDLFTSFNGRAFAMVEHKVGIPKRSGQTKAFEQMCMATGQTKPCMFVVITSPEGPFGDETDDIDAATCNVHSIYFVSPALGIPETWRADDYTLKLNLNDVMAAYAHCLRIPYRDKLGADVPLLLSDPESPYVALDGLAALATKS
jgi:hypothetical protein